MYAGHDRGERAGDARPGKAFEAAGELQRAVAVVAAEEFVAAVAAERDLDVAARLAGQVVRRERGRVGERLAKHPRERGEVCGGVRADAELVVLGAEMLGDAA